MNQAPRNRAASTDRNYFRAVLYAVIALCLVVTLIGIVSTMSLETSVEQLAFAVLGLPALIAARKSYRHFKKRHVTIGDNAAVLFLRPFDRDAGWDGAAAFSVYRPRTWLKLFNPVASFTALYLELTGRLSFEQVLAFVTKNQGALCAIGEPGAAPILGAQNIYVGDDGWQEKVIEIAQRCSLIVLTAGTSEGVVWEVENIVSITPPEQLLLNIPGNTKSLRIEAYDEFVQVCSRYFPCGLPESLNGARFLCFDNNWQPLAQKKWRSATGKPPAVARRMNNLLI